MPNLNAVAAYCQQVRSLLLPDRQAAIGPPSLCCKHASVLRRILHFFRKVRPAEPTAWPVKRREKETDLHEH